jgi:hypothetical protein
MCPPFLVAGKRWTFYITGLISASNALTDLTNRIRNTAGDEDEHESSHELCDTLFE